MEDYKEYTVIARPFYREHPPMLKEVLAKNETDAHDTAIKDREVKETLEAKLTDEIQWNEQIKEKYWSLYR